MGVDLQESIRNLQSSVSELFEWRSGLDGARFAAAHTSHSSHSSLPLSQSVDTRLLIREELIELKERDKCRETVVIRRLHFTNETDFLYLFDHLTMTLLKKKIQLSDVTQLNSHFIRAKILNKDDRISLLSSSSKLKNHPQYSTVYISKDLTYRQRQEIKNRRSVAQQQWLVVALLLQGQTLFLFLL